MKVETSRGVLFIEFRHTPPDIGVDALFPELGKQLLNFPDAGTYCIIKKEDHTGDIVSQAQSVLHKLDLYVFNREKGRKRSLKRVINKLGLKKEDRGAMWGAYINR